MLAPMECSKPETTLETGLGILPIAKEPGEYDLEDKPAPRHELYKPEATGLSGDLMSDGTEAPEQKHVISKEPVLSLMCDELVELAVEVPGNVMSDDLANPAPNVASLKEPLECVMSDEPAK
jgi:hypothetical protein